MSVKTKGDPQCFLKSEKIAIEVVIDFTGKILSRLFSVKSISRFFCTIFFPFVAYCLMSLGGCHQRQKQLRSNLIYLYQNHNKQTII